MCVVVCVCVHVCKRVFLRLRLCLCVPFICHKSLCVFIEKLLFSVPQKTNNTKNCEWSRLWRACVNFYKLIWFTTLKYAACPLSAVIPTGRQTHCHNERDVVLLIMSNTYALEFDDPLSLTFQMSYRICLTHSWHSVQKNTWDYNMGMGNLQSASKECLWSSMRRLTDLLGEDHETFFWENLQIIYENI